MRFRRDCARVQQEKGHGVVIVGGDGRRPPHRKLTNNPPERIPCRYTHTRAHAYTMHNIVWAEEFGAKSNPIVVRRDENMSSDRRCLSTRGEKKQSLETQ